MHPILAKRERLLIYLSAWLIIGVLLASIAAVPGSTAWVAALLLLLPLAIVYAFVCLSAWHLCRAFPLHRTALTRLLLVALLAGTITSSFFVTLGLGWQWFLGQLPFFVSLGASVQVDARMMLGIGSVLYLLTLAVHYLLVTFEESRAAERQAYEAKLLAQEAELKALRSQIDPHFLFNSLNSISALTTKNPHAARHMTLLLSDFLRASLKVGSQEAIPLEEEISLAEKFLEIEQVRFGTRLRVQMSVDDAAKPCFVPTLLLQPLFENAITHGIAHLVDGGTIRLQAYRNGSSLTVKIENPCDPDRPTRTGNGVGLENVKMRLRALYKNDARVEVYEDKRLFRVELSLPARTSSQREPA